ncbi:ABC transporter ATP-binding protein [Rhodobacter sp. SGA-6-6]|uniref:ABC transporter ATP-binding protein n=1 Tax=Rhodobacter sp. SGA-6-6 TaxID=2710882 RepID=UPI0013EDAE28|nr:ABC transporter ATP-binding protein [Rhodobacter sp. SGA-6-6]NGM46081.1 ABC transporter ATP-binding protein [Rhodobacter sp. SGA-6-6]
MTAKDSDLVTPPAGPEGTVQIEVKDITKRFGEFTALERVNLQIRRGEFLTLLGPSGSGKSTFLNILAGFDFATEGQLVMGGKDLTFTPPEDRNFGMVFQGYALFPHLTVEQNIAFPLRVRKIRADEQKRRVAEVVRRVGLEDHARKYPRQLSGGQQQRVALARALIFSPALLLLDEPFSALDKNLREQLQFEVKRIHREFGSTFVFVTHDQSEALSMSDRVAIFDGGRVQQIGTPEQVYDAPGTEFVAKFLGQLNLFPVTGQQHGPAGVSGLFEGNLLRAAGGKPGFSKIGIRPEHATLYDAEPPQAQNRVAVALRGTAYHGASVLVDLVTTGDQRADVVLQMNAAEWAARFAQTTAPLWIGWPPEKSLILA